MRSRKGVTDREPIVREENPATRVQRIALRVGQMQPSVGEEETSPVVVDESGSGAGKILGCDLENIEDMPVFTTHGMRLHTDGVAPGELPALPQQHEVDQAQEQAVRGNREFHLPAR